jgi:hypothetical protein
MDPVRFASWQCAIKIGGEAVSEGMAKSLLVDARPAHGVAHSALDILPSR